MLRWRLIAAAVIIAVIAVLCWLDLADPGGFGRPGVWLMPVGLLAAGLAVAELLGMWESNEQRPATWVVYAGVLLVVASAGVPHLWRGYPENCPLGKLGWPLSALAVAVVLALVGEMLRYDGRGGVVVRIALATFAFTYVGLLMTFVVQLRFWGDNARGMFVLLSFIVVVKMSDVGAFVVGKIAGRHKLVPRLSPGKTVEGAIGGLLAAALSAWVMFTQVAPAMIEVEAPTPWAGYVAYAVILTLAGMIGDLAASLIKRDAGRKDSGQWLPGLGGMLDVLDSLLVAAPAAYACWVFGLVAV